MVNLLFVIQTLAAIPMNLTVQTVAVLTHLGNATLQTIAEITLMSKTVRENRRVNPVSLHATTETVCPKHGKGNEQDSF